MSNIVLVDWIDAQGGYDRVTKEELREIQPLMSHSVGFLLIGDKDKLILGFTAYGSDLEVFKHFQIIPKAMIVKITTLKKIKKGGLK